MPLTKDTSSELRDTVEALSQALQDRTCEYKKLYDLLSQLGECAPNFYWAKDLSGKYIYANKKHVAWLGVTDCIGLTDVEISAVNKSLMPLNRFYHDFGEICVNSDNIVIKLNKPIRFLEAGNVRGKYCCMQVHKAPLYSRGGTVIGTVGAAIDVTERIKIREEIFSDLYSRLNAYGMQNEFKDIMERFRAYCDRHRFTEGQIRNG